MKYQVLSLCLLFSLSNYPKTKHILSKKITQELPNLRAEISCGELIDKITILEIKTEKISDPEKLRNIWNELEALINTFYLHIPQTKEIEQLKNDLKKINEKLWDIENDIRAKDATEEFDAAFIALARAVYMTNDERGVIKRKINEVCGSRLVEEKEYTKYNNSI